MQVPQPYNPGLSEKAWNSLHRKLAALNIKYLSEIEAGRKARKETTI